MLAADLPEWASTIGVLAGVIVTVGTAGRMLVRWLRGMATWIVGEVDERVEQQVAPLRDELHPDSGHSFRDHLDRRFTDLDGRVEENSRRLTGVEGRLGQCEGELRQIWEQVR